MWQEDASDVKPVSQNVRGLFLVRGSLVAYLGHVG